MRTHDEIRAVREKAPPRKLGYIEWNYWANENIRQGIKQSQCVCCKLWFFPGEKH